MGSKKYKILQEYQQALMVGNSQIINKTFYALLLVGLPIWLVYEIYLYYTNSAPLTMVLLIFSIITLTLIVYWLKGFLLSRKHYRTFQVIFCFAAMFYMIYNMRFHLDSINTRTPNPDKTLPYFIAVGHMLGMGIILMIAFLWYL